MNESTTMNETADLVMFNKSNASNNTKAEIAATYHLSPTSQQIKTTKQIMLSGGNSTQEDYVKTYNLS